MDHFQIPHDAALELHIISAMIYDPSCIVDVAEVVKPRFFYINKYKMLCESIFTTWKEDEKKISIQGMAPAIEKSGIVLSEIMEGIRSIATTADIKHLGQRLKDIAAMRAAVKVGQELIESSAVRDGQGIRDAIANAEMKLSKITSANIQVETMRPLKEILVGFSERLEALSSSADASGITGKSSGFRDLDNMTAGFQDSDLIILAARPSVGKTAFALNVAENMGARYNDATAFFSLEMAADPLAARLVSRQSMIDGRRLRSGLLHDDDWEKYTMGVGKLSESNLLIDEQPGMTIAEMKAKLRKVKREYGLSCVFIDYLGLIKGDPKLNRYDLVSENARELKNLAREFKVPVICLCQLSRGVEQRQEKRPMMSDLRESGEIEQTADVIAFLYRDDYYDKETEKKNIIEIIIAKQRNGPTGTVELAFMKDYNKFLSLDRSHFESVKPTTQKQVTPRQKQYRRG